MFLSCYQRTAKNRKNRITIHPTFWKTAIWNSARRYRPAIIDRRRPIVFRDGTLRTFNRSGQIFVVTFQFLPEKEENWFYRLRLWCSSCRQCSPSSLEERSEIGNRRKRNEERRRKKERGEREKECSAKEIQCEILFHFTFSYKLLADSFRCKCNVYLTGPRCIISHPCETPSRRNRDFLPMQMPSTGSLFAVLVEFSRRVV